MAMDEKDRRAIDELLSGEYNLSPFEKKVLKEWSDEDRNISFNMRVKILDPTIDKHLNGGDGKVDAPMSYLDGRIELKRTTQGYFIVLDGEVVGRSCAKTEGQMVLQWLSTAWESICDVHGIEQGDESGEEEIQDEFTKKEDAPF